MAGTAELGLFLEIKSPAQVEVNAADGETIVQPGTKVTQIPVMDEGIFWGPEITKLGALVHNIETGRVQTDGYPKPSDWTNARRNVTTEMRNEVEVNFVRLPLQILAANNGSKS